MSAARPRVAVVHNEPVLSTDHPDAASEADVLNVAGVVAEALERHGFEVSLIGAAPPLAGFVARLDAMAPDVVFNLAEGFGGRSTGATHLTSVFELLRLPYTGSPVESLAACQSKSRTLALIREHGLPSAPSFTWTPGQAVPELPWEGPAIVKPDEEDGSLGIDHSSVVQDRPALIERMEWLHAQYGGRVLVEAYLPGDEFNMGLVALPEPVALPVARIQFWDRPDVWPIVTYAAKWDVDSEEDQATQAECPARIDPVLATRLSQMAVAAFCATSCRDYARVDFRLDARGEPTILEVNPNPDIGLGAGWARALRVSGRDHAATIAEITRQALARGGRGR